MARLKLNSNFTRRDMEKLKPCRCCGELTIEEYGDFDICDVCGWEDDDIQFDDPGYAGGANKMSLNQAKEAYKNSQKII